jgi:hypothetical protein
MIIAVEIPVQFIVGALRFAPVVSLPTLLFVLQLVIGVSVAPPRLLHKQSLS